MTHVQATPPFVGRMHLSGKVLRRVLVLRLMHSSLHPQVSFIDKTAMPVSGRVVMTSFSGYSPQVNAAFTGECLIADVSVCAWNTINDAVVACTKTAEDGSYFLGVTTGMTIKVNASLSDRTFQPSLPADEIYVTGPVQGLNFQVRAAHGWM